MVSIIVRDWGTGELYGHLKSRKLDSFSNESLLPVLNKEKNIFPLDDVKFILSSGITKYQSRSRVITNKPADADVSSFEPEFMKVKKTNGDGEETSIKLHVMAYPAGYVLNVGVPVTNIFGVSSPGYLKNISSRHYAWSSLYSCHLFSTLSSMLKYVKNHKKDLERLRKNLDCCYSFEFACDEWKEEIQKKGIRKAEQTAEKALTELLDEINAVEEDERYNIPTNPIQSDVYPEIGFRMEKLNLKQNIQHQFKKSGKIYMSEFGGILYDLDEDAKAAVSQAEGLGYVPYHVIVSHANIGNMYAVLYASTNTAEWKYERPEQGQMFAYVYNAEEPSFSEIGTIKVQPANGGLIRTT